MLKIVKSHECYFCLNGASVGYCLFDSVYASVVWCMYYDVLWQTHDNLEHLAIMERVLGPIPASMIRETKYDLFLLTL